MKKLFSLLLLHFILIQTANAEKIYLGASFGDAKTSNPGYNKPIAYKFYLGYNTNDNFAFELGFINMGDFINSSVTLKVTGTELSAVGLIPVGTDSQVFGKIGLFNWSQEAYLSGAQFSSASDTDYLIGFGLQVPIKDNTLFRIEFQEFRDKDDNDVIYTFLSIGGVLKF